MPRARISKRDAALIRKFKVELRERQQKEKFPDPPHLENGEPTEAGLLLIRMAAERGATQNKIAGLLHLSRDQWKRLVGPATGEPTPTRLAWEGGDSSHESALFEHLTERAEDGDSNAALALLRMKHGHRDSGPTVTIDQSEKRLTILMPGSMPEAEYYAKLGITGPIDTRSPERIEQVNADLGRLKYEPGPPADIARIAARPLAPPAPNSETLPHNPDRVPLTPQNGYPVSPTFNRQTSF